MVDGQYKFRWVDVSTAGSCTDAQIFNTCHLKRKIDDGSIGFPDPAPITQGGRDAPYFILADDAFALRTWLMKPYGRRMLTREERIANYRISRGRRVVENAFGILVSRFRVMMTTIELPPETVRDVVLTCVVLHNILRSQYQGQHGGQQPGDDDCLDYWSYWEFIYLFFSMWPSVVMCITMGYLFHVWGGVGVGFFVFRDKYLY